MKKASLYTLCNLFIAAAMIAPVAHAADADHVDLGKDGHHHPAPTPPVSWDDFKDSCEHPGKFHNQVPPSNIKIQCTDIRREWVPIAPGELPPEMTRGQRRVVFAVVSNKYHVAADALDSILPPSGKAGSAGASCLRYKEVERTLTVEKALTCDDILNIKFNLGEYCTSILDGSKGSNKAVTDSRDTGNWIDTCSDPRPNPGPLPLPPQKPCKDKGKDKDKGKCKGGDHHQDAPHAA